MNCECNNNSNRVKPRIKHVYGNVLRMAIPLTLRTLVKDGDEMIVNDTDFIPSSDHLVRVVLSKGKTNYPITATMDGNVAIIEDKGKIPVGTYDISVECYDDLDNPYRFKQNAVLYVADATAEAGIDEEIEYEAQTWYLNAAVFLATTEIGEIGDVIDAKLDDVFGNVLYDANAKEIRFYNKSNSRVLATIDSRPFIVDGTVADVYIDVSRQVLVVVLNEDAGGRRFSVPLYLVFNSYYKKDEVDSLVSRTVEGVRFDFSQELPLVVPVTKNGSSISSPIDYGAIVNAIREDGRLVVACVNNAKYYQLLADIGMEVAFSRVVALDGYQELLIVDESNVWSFEVIELGTGGGGGYEPPAGGIPKSDLAQSVQDTLDDVGNKVDKESGKSLMTDAERTKLQGIAAGAEVNVQADWNQTTTTADDYIKNKPTKVSDFTNDSGFTSNAGTITGITMNGVSKGTSGVVDLGTVITAHQDISGKANASEVYTKTQADTLLAGKLSKSDVSVETQGDGTVDINVKDDTYTINLNHTHEGMAKLVVDTAANLPDASEMESDTIYGELDDGEIATIYLGGYPFYGGGASSVPVLRSPADGATIDMGQPTSGTVSQTINVKGKNLTQALTIGLTGTGFTFDNTQPSDVTVVSTTELSVTAAAANAGVNIVVVYSGTKEIAGATLSIVGTTDNIDCQVTLNYNNLTPLSFIKSTGSQLLITNYFPNPLTHIEIDMQFENNGNASVSTGMNNTWLGTNGTPTNGAFRANFNALADSYFEVLYWFEKGYVSDTWDGVYRNVLYNRSTWVYRNNQVTFNGVVCSTESKTTTQDKELVLFGNIADTVKPFTRHNLKIWSVKIYENNVLLHEYLPYQRISDGENGLYDTVTGDFFTSETSTNFIGG